MNNDYQLVFAPELGIDPAEFVAVWNAEHRELAEAQVMATQQTNFTVEPVTTIVMTVLATTILQSVAQDIYTVVKNLLAKMLEKQQPTVSNHPVIEVQEIPQPDGSRLLIVKIKEQTTEVHRSESQN